MMLYDKFHKKFETQMIIAKKEKRNFNYSSKKNHRQERKRQTAWENKIYKNMLRPNLSYISM